MSERRVRSVGRPVYGRPQPLPGRRRGLRLRMGIIPRRLIILVFGGLVLVFILKQSFDINKVDVKSSARSAEIQTQVRALTQTRWRQQNLLTLDATTLENDLLAADPMLKSVEIKRRWPHGIIATAVLKQPSLGWSSGNQAYLLDRDGSAIGLLPAGLALPVVVDGSNLPVELGKKVTSVRFVSFTTEVATALASLELNPTRYEVKDTTLDLYVTTNKGYQLIFDTSRSAGDEVSDLRALLGFLKGKAPAQYIDLRIAGKAYYK